MKRHIGNRFMIIIIIALKVSKNGNIKQNINNCYLN